MPVKKISFCFGEFASIERAAEVEATGNAASMRKLTTQKRTMLTPFLARETEIRGRPFVYR
jgi:hypothetical protein